MVRLDHDVLGRQRAAGAPLDLLAHVEQPVGPVLDRHEPALRLDVGDRERRAPVGHREGAHAQSLAEHAGGRTAREHRAAAADPVAAQVDGLAGEGAVGVGVDRAAGRSHEVRLRELGLGRRREPREHENGGNRREHNPSHGPSPTQLLNEDSVPATPARQTLERTLYPAPDAAGHLPRQPPLHPRRRARRRAGARLRRRDHDRVALRRGARADRLGPPADRPPPPRSRPHPTLRARLLRLRGARRRRVEAQRRRDPRGLVRRAGLLLLQPGRHLRPRRRGRPPHRLQHARLRARDRGRDRAPTTRSPASPS